MSLSSHPKSTGLRKQSGQVVLEYVFLLMIGVGVAALITSMVVSRNPESPGFLIVKWRQIIDAVGTDSPEDLNTAP